jgi:predicted nucleic acid-binding protein
MNLFIDTNVLLSFYHLTSDDLEELRKLSVLIDKGKIQLLLPIQVVNEFRRNRENKIADALKRLRDQNLKLQFPQMCKDYPEYNELKTQQISYSKSHSELIKKMSDDINKHKLKADKITTELFEKATIIKQDEEIIKNAKLRIELGNPPGKNKSLGDAINWETVLIHVEQFNDLHFVTDDKDYYSVLDNNAFNEFLLIEWEEKKNSNILCYRRLSTFFKEHYPDIKLASEIEKELLIKELSESTSFASTHTSISKLSRYSDFTIVQVDEILEATISNTQINWIITDNDVKDFICTIIEGKEDRINEDNLRKINELIKDEEESDGNPPSSEDEEFPF